jgi:hypothetical protein
MQTYEDSIPFTGSAEDAFTLALESLLPLGFRIEAQNSARLVLTNPSSKGFQQHALQGISRAEFALGPTRLSVKAELGGVERLQKSMLLVVLGLGSFDVLLFTGLWYFIPALHPHTWFLFIPLVALIPWAVTAPRMAARIRQRTLDALRILLNNLSAA